MKRLIVLDCADDLAALSPGAVQPLDVAAFRLTAPLCHLALLDDLSGLLARCSVWRARDADGQPTVDGLVGHYAAANAQVGKELLLHAADWHRADGCKRIIGPMDGSTWHHYRLLTERGNEPTFFLEPDNPDDWPAHFTDAEFTTLATYFSVLNVDLTHADPRTDQRLAECERQGITFRTIKAEHFATELSAIHELSLAAFAGNLLYSPIELDVFMASYAPLRAHVVPELVILAEQYNELVGFVFGTPDLMEPGRGEPQRTAIVKSLAVHPACAGNGLGSLLMHECQQAARRLGFERVIHALMHENNWSRSISANYGSTMRRYTLYAKVLSLGS